jgi:hypothetical protein
LPIVSINKKIILGGDFNCVADLSLDKSQNSQDKSKVSRAILKELTGKANLIDAYRHKHPNGKETTCFNAPKNTHSRIDRLYIDASLADTILKTEHITNSFSDHCSVALSLKAPKNRGRGYWKCNVKTLDDPYFSDDFNFLWASLTSCPKANIDLEWWESCKLEFRKLIVHHSKRIVASRNNKIFDLNKQIDRLTKQKAGDQLSNNQALISDLEAEKNALLDNIHEGSKIRARVNHLDTTDKPLSFF